MGGLLPRRALLHVALVWRRLLVLRGPRNLGQDGEGRLHVGIGKAAVRLRLYKVRSEPLVRCRWSVIEDDEPRHRRVGLEPTADLCGAVGILLGVEGRALGIEPIAVCRAGRAPDDERRIDALAVQDVLDVRLEASPEGGEHNAAAGALHNGAQPCHAVVVETDVRGTVCAIEHAVDVEKEHSYSCLCAHVGPCGKLRRLLRRGVRSCSCAA